MDATETTLIVGAIGSVLAFLGTVVNMINTNFKEQRARRWAAEDKLDLACKTKDALEKANAETLAHFEKTQKALDEITVHANGRLATILAGQEAIAKKVDENTVVSVEAFKEANGVNAKLVAIGLDVAKSVNAQKVVVVNEQPIEVHNKP